MSSGKTTRSASSAWSRYHCSTLAEFRRSADGSAQHWSAPIWATVIAAPGEALWSGVVVKSLVLGKLETRHDHAHMQVGLVGADLEAHASAIRDQIGVALTEGFHHLLSVIGTKGISDFRFAARDDVHFVMPK